MNKEKRKDYGDIIGLHVFRGDTAQTTEWSDDKLKKIVDNFNELKESPDAFLKPTVKISHADGQAALATNLGLLGFGFVERLRKIGRDFYADMTNVPNRIIEALKTGELSPQP